MATLKWSRSQRSATLAYSRKVSTTSMFAPSPKKIIVGRNKGPNRPIYNLFEPRFVNKLHREPDKRVTKSWTELAR